MTIVRPASKRDSVGGFETTVETTIHTNLPCRINWSRAREKVIFGKDDYLRDAKVYCCVVDMEATDVVIINNVRYDIVSITDVDSVGKYIVLEIIKIVV